MNPLDNFIESRSRTFTRHELGFQGEFRGLFDKDWGLMYAGNDTQLETGEFVSDGNELYRVTQVMRYEFTNVVKYSLKFYGLLSDVKA